MYRVSKFTELRRAVLRRDGFRCVAPQIDKDAGPCRDKWDRTIIWRIPSVSDPGSDRIELNHVQDADKIAMAKKAPDDINHLVSLCPFHHRGTKAGSNWEAVHRDDLRQWIIDHR